MKDGTKWYGHTVNEYERAMYLVMVRNGDSGLPLTYNYVMSRDDADTLVNSLRHNWQHIWIARVAMECHANE